MNFHFQSSEFEDVRIPLLTNQLLTIAADAPDLEKAARALGRRAYDHANSSVARAIKNREEAKLELACRQADEAACKKDLAGLQPAREWATPTPIAPVSLIARGYTSLLVLAVLADSLLAMFTGATYLAGTGTIEGVTTVLTAMPFAVCFVIGVLVLSAIGESQPNEMARTRFKKAVLTVGMIFHVPYVLLFASLFNPATQQLIDPANVGSGLLVGAGPLSYPAAAALTALGLLGTITFGAGMKLHLKCSADINKVLHREPSSQYIEVAERLVVLREECLSLQQIIASNTAYIDWHTAAREDFIMLTTSRAFGLRKRISDFHAAAYHEIVEKFGK